VVVTTSPWRLVDYWRWTREPDLADFEPISAANIAATAGAAVQES
jgi:hypothetical protein